jgi:transcription antitermination factor NusG
LGQEIEGKRNWDSEGEAVFESISYGAESGDQPRWYAVHTKPRHEKRIGAELHKKGIETFVPTIAEMHRWSDRRKRVEVPLFSCYAFFRVSDLDQTRYWILTTPGVFRVVGTQSHATAIPDHEIESFKRLVATGVPMATSVFLNAGQRVRIRGGALDGVEGILEWSPGEDRIVVSIELIRRAVSVSLSGYDIEPA